MVLDLILVFAPCGMLVEPQPYVSKTMAAVMTSASVTAMTIAGARSLLIGGAWNLFVCVGGKTILLVGISSVFMADGITLAGRSSAMMCTG